MMHSGIFENIFISPTTNNNDYKLVFEHYFKLFP